MSKMSIFTLKFDKVDMNKNTISPIHDNSNFAILCFGLVTNSKNVIWLFLARISHSLLPSCTR